MQKGHRGPMRPSPGLPTGATRDCRTASQPGRGQRRDPGPCCVSPLPHGRACVSTCAHVYAHACARVRLHSHVHVCVPASLPAPPPPTTPARDHDLFPASVSLSFRGCRTRGSLRDVPRGLGFLHAAGRPGDCRSPCVTGSSPMPLPRPPPPARVTLDRSPVQERWDVFSLGLLRIKLL